MDNVIEHVEECRYCDATGVYTGMAERDGAAVLCTWCDGTGEYHYKHEFTPFTGRKKRDRVERVYRGSYGYVIAADREIDFGEMGTVDMTKEGVSYEEFLSGKEPQHIRQLACPMRADQGACHRKRGFVDGCHALNGGWISLIPSCKHQCRKAECWKRFYGEE